MPRAVAEAELAAAGFDEVTAHPLYEASGTYALTARRQVPQLR